MRQRGSRSTLRYTLPWLLTSLVPVGAAGAVALAVLVQPSPVGSRTPPGPTLIGPPTGFGGYRYQSRSPVTQVAAQWRVPEVLPDSPDGYAGTWIGAENQAGDFVQIGTNELKTDSVQPIYLAFWSDVPVGFHPQLLGVVHAGDLISAEMVQRPDGWHLSLIDGSVRLHKSVDPGYGRGKRFTATEWTQEDPLGRNGAPTDLPYPKTSPVSFFNLDVNGHHPRLVFADGVSLASPNGIYLVPSHPDSDGFVLRPASTYQAQYLEDIRPLNFAIVQFEGAVIGLGSVSESEATVELDSALRTFRVRLEQQRWPPMAARRVPPLIRAVSNLIPRIRDFGTTRRSLDQARAFVLNTTPALTQASRSLRAALRLPPH